MGARFGFWSRRRLVEFNMVEEGGFYSGTCSPRERSSAMFAGAHNV